MDLKRTVIEIAQSLGFGRAVIASLEPMDSERLRFETWLSKGYAAGMEYLKRNPELRTSPHLLFPEARSAIIVSVSYYTQAPAHPGNGFGRVAGYAVGLDYHKVLADKLKELQGRLELAVGRPLLGKPYTDDVALYEQGFANRSGLGFQGKNTLIIGPKLMGTYNFVAELFTDLEIEPDESYQGTCGNCFRCGSACPTQAIEPGAVNANLCISYLTIENRGGIPIDLRAQLGDWVFGCDVCQQVCPYNQRPADTPWVEFYPGSGVGHFLNLLDLLKIANKAEFLKRFGQTALTRPKLKGLQRNALVVLGNQKPEFALQEIVEFAEIQTDPMLKEHAVWAISQTDSSKGKQAIERLYKMQSDQTHREQLSRYL